MNAPLCFIDGQFLLMSEAGVGVRDLGLQRGYGVFDFLRVKNQQPLFLNDHLNRFYQSAQAMHLQVPYHHEALTEIIHQLIKANQLAYSGIRITLTGGTSEDGYQVNRPTLMVVQQSISPPPDTPVVTPYRLVTREYQRQLPTIKTTDYLMAIWLQPWIKEQGAQDVLYHWQGTITECPRSNIFMVTKDDTIVTPLNNVLPGVTRKHLLEIAADSFAVETRNIQLSELASAKEVFVTSSTKRILPVTSIDHFFAASYTSNSICHQLFNALQLLEASAPV